MANMGYSLDTAVFVDGKVAKLRASCDGCNESKVRCSQSRPQCSRCQKQGVPCIYGLSRRTHKTAPRIGDSQQSPVIGLAQPLSIGPSHNRSSITVDQGPNTGDQAAADDMMDLFAEANGSSDTFFSLGITEDFNSFFDPSLGVVPSSADMTFAPTRPPCSSPTSPLSTKPSDEAAGPRALLDQPCYSEMGHDNIHKFTANAKVVVENQECSCMPQLMRHMHALSSILQRHKRTSFDMQLSQLKCAVKQAEESLGCACTSGDDVKISKSEKLLIIALLYKNPRSLFIIALLTLLCAFVSWLDRTVNILTFCAVNMGACIGRILQGFDATLRSSSEAKARSMFKDHQQQGPDDDLPRLSTWGVLELEEDDEGDLRQHLWLMQFRKLEKLLRHFSETAVRFRNSQVNDNTANCMVCEYIDMWLGQKAEGIKERCLAKE